MTGFLKAVVLIIVALFVAMLAFAAGFGTNYFYSHGGAASPAAVITSLQPPQKFGLMWEAWKILKDKFYYDIPTQSSLPTLVNFDSTVTTTPKSSTFFNQMFAQLKRQLSSRD